MRSYQLLPFRFERFPNDKVLVVNEAGEFIFLPGMIFSQMLDYNLDKTSEHFLNLKSKHILTNTGLASAIDMLATKYRTKKRFLYSFTTLHMIVITLRCNSSCTYCQASVKDKRRQGYDMNKSTARKVVDLIFQSPSSEIKIEFQGGEPLLNFSIIKFIVKYAQILNKVKKKRLEFVLCTNLTLASTGILQFLKRNNILISTSLDGPRSLHNRHRVLQNGKGGYDYWQKNMQQARKVFGNEGIDALMTITRDNLHSIKEVVNEYVAQGFHGIFLRTLNPYGFARQKIQDLGYDVEDFLSAYREGLQYIIELNIKGVFFIEHYAAILLSKILTPFSTGFVDLQSPAGIGIQGVIYNYDGNVYVSDEGRMLAAMGDNQFLMGNVHKNCYKDIFASGYMRELIGKACLESLPGCCSCAFFAFCGADPVRNYLEQGDVIGHRPTSKICKKNKEVIRYLFELVLQGDDDVLDVFWSWLTMRPLEKVKMSPEICNESALR